MSDAAAVSLGEWFLADSQTRTIDALVEVLQGDPPFALWVALKADRPCSAPPRTISDLAVLLAEHGLAWLQWDAGSADTVIGASSSGEVAARVAVAVLVSELAADLAAAHGETASLQARFFSLLQDPAQWLAEVNPTDSRKDEIRPPNWLAPNYFDPAAIEAVERSVSRLRAAPLPPDSEHASSIASAKLDVSPAYVQRRLDVASQWAATHQAARWLRPLMANLARLSVLERPFRETVEVEKIAAMAEFAAGAGHEINNPLAVIAGRAQLLLRDETDSERRRDLALINAQAMRVHEMIADLRLFATPPELERESFDLTILVRRLADDMQCLAAGQETSLSLADASSELWVQADAVQLTVALRSLCQNSLEAVRQGGRIEIVVRGEGDQALIRVADDGPGIIAEQRQHIFEPFYSARQAGRGVGMGLTKCWRIVTQHGGRIEVDSRAGSGAAFTIRLPLERPETADLREHR